MHYKKGNLPVEIEFMISSYKFENCNTDNFQKSRAKIIYNTIKIGHCENWWWLNKCDQSGVSQESEWGILRPHSFGLKRRGLWKCNSMRELRKHSSSLSIALTAEKRWPSTLSLRFAEWHQKGRKPSYHDAREYLCNMSGATDPVGHNGG